MTEKALSVMGLTRRYKKDAGIFDVTFEVDIGEIVGLVGGERSGKTTLLRAIAGLCAFDGGNVFVMDYDVAREHVPASAQLGTVIDEPVFYDYMTAEGNMRAAARLCGNVSKERVGEVFEMMGMELCKKDKPYDFTPQMRMKLGIGLAVLSNPRVILLDEPFKPLSDTDREILREMILEMNRDYGTTFLVSSQELYDFDGICDKIGIMENGRLAAFDIAKNIFEQDYEKEKELFEHSAESVGAEADE